MNNDEKLSVMYNDEHGHYIATIFKWCPVRKGWFYSDKGVYRVASLAELDKILADRKSKLMVN